MGLEGKRVLLIVTGSVAAYKSVELFRMLQKKGAALRVILTHSAGSFVTRGAFEAFGAEVMSGFDEDVKEGLMRHIHWAQTADVVLVAPATADFIAKAAAGSAESPALAALLATRAPVLLAPAMNEAMLTHAITQENLKRLKPLYHIAPTGEGELACGTTGQGRLWSLPWLASEVEFLASEVSRIQPKKQGRMTLGITLGASREYLDTVRFISNPSSGLMGQLLARAFSRLGDEVLLFSAHCEIPPSEGFESFETPTAEGMLQALLSQKSRLSALLSVAALGDIRPEPHKTKLPKEELIKSLKWQLNTDVLSEFSKKNKGAYLVGFAAQDAKGGLEKARQKRLKKGLNAILYNPVSQLEGFGGSLLAPPLHEFVWIDDKEEQAYRGSKLELAHLLACRIHDEVLAGSETRA